ncbi:Anti-sigma-K factor rskA [Plantibacter sp. VKM Ac-1784]|uniref:Regulator of SigK n=1 Tax=Plantibacter elymi (nom. nud.) TaxID=199708 RepID=A0ABY1REW2_9MICO|nr:anti-sigma factor [Plantibacter sp. VKM Ac-1784]SMQ72336.1 Anti-sigma-K factor rskA [Plantibacter sp. VKM Ac-1784]
MTERDDATDLAAGNALHTLTPREQERFDRLRAEHESVREEAAEFEETVAMLDLAAPPVQPSAALKNSLMAAIQNLPQLPADAPVDAPVAEVQALPTAVPDVDETLVSTPIATPTPAAAITPAAPVAGAAERKAASRWRRSAVGMVVGAAAAVGLIFGGVGLANTFGGGSLTQTVALAEINAASDVQRAKVSMDDATATLVWSGELGKSALLVDGLGSLPSDKVYELWYIGEGGPVSAGTFSAANGTTWRVLDGAMSAGDKVGVTVEPQGGSEQPTTDPIMVIETA